jgi:hypothetical protein
VKPPDGQQSPDARGDRREIPTAGTIPADGVDVKGLKRERFPPGGIAVRALLWLHKLARPVALALVTWPLVVCSKATWILESVRSRLQTDLANYAP